MEKHDVVIVGAGPAGLKAAEVLAAAGKDVLVLEKNKVVGPKVCAGSLTLKDIKIGIPKELFDKEFHPVLMNKKISVEYKEGESIVITISREKLGQWQNKKAEDAGAIIRTGIRVTKLEKNHVVTDRGNISFNYLIGADGSSSLIRRELGIKTENILMGMQYITKQEFNKLVFFFDSKKFKSGYAWIFPHNNYTSVGCCADINSISSKDLRESFHEWFREQKIDTKKAKFEAFPINYDYRGFKFGNVFLAGDAAGFASGLTGEGIYFALASGEDVAKQIISPNHETKKIENIVKIKKRHEFALNILKRSGFSRKYIHELVLLCSKNHIVRKYLANYAT